MGRTVPPRGLRDFAGARSPRPIFIPAALLTQTPGPPMSFVSQRPPGCVVIVGGGQEGRSRHCCHTSSWPSWSVVHPGTRAVCLGLRREGEAPGLHPGHQVPLDLGPQSRHPHPRHLQLKGWLSCSSLEQGARSKVPRRKFRASGELACTGGKRSVSGPLLSGSGTQICSLVCDLEEIINLIST